MANSRITRFVMEVAPPQFVTVMRHRTVKMLDTISEEEKDVGAKDSLPSSSKCFSSASASASASASSAASATAAAAAVLRGVQVQRSFAIFE